VASSNLIRPQVTVTDGQGRYRFANLSPGKYSVAVDANGCIARFEQANVEVNLSKTSTFDVKLQPQGTSAVVEITACASELDLNSNTTGTNGATEQFSNLPTHLW
jgi:uncharacterized membrane protein